MVTTMLHLHSNRGNTQGCVSLNLLYLLGSQAPVKLAAVSTHGQVTHALRTGGQWEKMRTRGGAVGGGLREGGVRGG